MTQTRTGNANISFYTTDVGQIQFTTTALGGINHIGRLTYFGRALVQN